MDVSGRINQKARGVAILLAVKQKRLGKPRMDRGDFCGRRQRRAAWPSANAPCLRRMCRRPPERHRARWVRAAAPGMDRWNGYVPPSVANQCTGVPTHAGRSVVSITRDDVAVPTQIVWQEHAQTITTVVRCWWWIRVAGGVPGARNAWCRPDAAYCWSCTAMWSTEAAMCSGSVISGIQLCRVSYMSWLVSERRRGHVTSALHTARMCAGLRLRRIRSLTRRHVRPDAHG